MFAIALGAAHVGIHHRTYELVMHCPKVRKALTFQGKDLARPVAYMSYWKTAIKKSLSSSNQCRFRSRGSTCNQMYTCMHSWANSMMTKHFGPIAYERVTSNMHMYSLKFAVGLYRSAQVCTGFQVVCRSFAGWTTHTALCFEAKQQTYSCLCMFQTLNIHKFLARVPIRRHCRSIC